MGEHDAGNDTGATSRKRILAVDDERFIVTLLKRILGAEFDIEATTSGREALEWITAGRHYDLILCDLMMPDVSGMDLFHAVEARLPAMLPRIVFLTGGAATPATQFFLDHVASATIEKPFDAPGLRAAVRTRLGTT